MELHSSVDSATSTPFAQGLTAATLVVRIRCRSHSPMDSPIRIVNAATLVCLRRSASSSVSWDVLLGQSEVKNWLRSTPTSTRIMRYPGEWKFPGGTVDSTDASLEATALRELEEEFLGMVPSNARVYFLSSKITRPIQRQRHRMVNFVAFQDENDSWMNADALTRVNEALAMKREEFAGHIESGRYWQMSDQQKMEASPEIHRVQWFPIEDAIRMMGASLFDPLTPIDDWQREQFDTHAVAKRDPMYISMRILQDIAAFASREELRTFVKAQHAPSLASIANMTSNL
jgi:ADP-ribose pyrophosphatase YjhB (NUDIX family)